MTTTGDPATRALIFRAVVGKKLVATQFSARSVVILELTGVHEEIIPSLVDALPPGTDVQVIVNKRCLDMRGDIFAEMDGLSCKIDYVEITKAIDWVQLGRRIDDGDHDALIISTFQIEGVALWAEQRALPVLGVVHNPTLFLNSDACKSAFTTCGTQGVVLAPHVAARFNSLTRGAHIDAIGVLEPVFWGEGNIAMSPVGEPKHVIIPGGVNFAARDFEGLLAALDPPRLAGLRAAGIVLQIIGGGPDRATLHDQIMEKDVGDVVDLLPISPSGRVPYDAYIAALRKAWAVYPLLPLNWPPYRDYKITSAIPTAIGFGLPVVLDRWTANAYRVPAVVSDGSIAAALDCLATLTARAHDEISKETRDYGRLARQRNRHEMTRLLSACGNLAKETAR